MLRLTLIAALFLCPFQSYALDAETDEVCFLTTKQIKNIGFENPVNKKLFAHCQKGDILLLEGGNIRFKNYLAAVARLCEFETIKLEFPDTNEYAAMCIFSGKLANIKEP